jgi:hypothetical protein
LIQLIIVALLLVANVRGDLMAARGISVTLPQENNPHRLEVSDNIEDDCQLPPSFDRIDTNCFFPWMQGRSKVSRLELQTTINMSINVLPFWLCTFSISCASIAIYWCVQLRGDCTILGLIMSYLRDAFLLHTIYNPVMYMCSSSEFWRALRHFAWKVKNGCVCRADVNANGFFFRPFVLNDFRLLYIFKWKIEHSSYFANLPFEMKEKYKMARCKYPRIYSYCTSVPFEI